MKISGVPGAPCTLPSAPATVGTLGFTVAVGARDGTFGANRDWKLASLGIGACKPRVGSDRRYPDVTVPPAMMTDGEEQKHKQEPENCTARKFKSKGMNNVDILRIILKKENASKTLY